MIFAEVHFDTIALALIAAAPPTIAAIAALIQSVRNGKKTDVMIKATNGNQTLLIAETEQRARLEGEADGRRKLLAEQATGKLERQHREQDAADYVTRTKADNQARENSKVKATPRD